MREKLPDRRVCLTENVIYVTESGRRVPLLVSFGLTHPLELGGRAMEVFCADFKGGSDMQALVMDACILLSRLLQHGDDIEELVKSMSGGDRPSIIGTLANAVADVQRRASAR